jgi:hypothetical protein
MSQLDQIQVSFAAAEDRLLLRISTQGNEEFRFWLTRRFVRALRPALTQSLAARPRIQTQADPLAKQELLRFEHEAALQKADFKTPFKGAERTLPLGPDPRVLTRCQLKPRQDGGVVLVVAPEQGEGVDIALNAQLLHSFVALLEHALASAEWDLAPAAPAPTAPAKPASLN